MSIPLRWRLLDERTGAVLTDCTDVDGLFVDRAFPSEPVYERYTLVDCVPSGPLFAAIDGTGPAWFGNVVVAGAHVPGRPVSERCGDQCRECYETMEELLDVRVVGHRPAVDGSGPLDIDLEGHRRDGHNNGGGTVPPTVLGYRLSLSSMANGSFEETPVGGCRDIGASTDPPGPGAGVRRKRLVGMGPGA